MQVTFLLVLLLFDPSEGWMRRRRMKKQTVVEKREVSVQSKSTTTPLPFYLNTPVQDKKPLGLGTSLIVHKRPVLGLSRQFGHTWTSQSWQNKRVLGEQCGEDACGFTIHCTCCSDSTMFKGKHSTHHISSIPLPPPPIPLPTFKSQKGSFFLIYDSFYFQ